MQLDSGRLSIAASVVAAIGIALLFFLSETPANASVAEALVSTPNSLLSISGTTANITSDKFSLCDRLCISVRSGGLPSASLLSNGGRAVVLGRLKEYQGRKYIEAERIDVQ